MFVLVGNTVDTIRGCVPRAQVDSVCLGLVAVERARGHSDARCYICYGDNCNSAFKHLFKLHLIVLSLLLYYILRWNDKKDTYRLKSRQVT